MDKKDDDDKEEEEEEEMNKNSYVIYGENAAVLFFSLIPLRC